MSKTKRPDDVIVLEGIGTVRTVVSHTDDLPPEEVKRRWDNLQRTANYLYRQMVQREMQKHEQEKKVKDE